MTELMSNVQMESLNGLDFSAHKKGVINESSEPALDLSTKKSPPASPASDRRSPLVSPQRASPALPESLEKNNNNESKYMSSYACIPHHSTPTIHLSQNHTHQYQLDESSRFSSSSHERKSPSFESRPCMMTPPSETDLPASPKKDNILPMYEQMSTESRSLNSNLNGYPMFNTLLPLPMNQTGSQYPAPSQSTSHMPEVNVHETLQISTDETKKAPRPFKAYPKDPLSLSLGPNIIFDQEIKKSYSEFRNKMLDSVKKTNEGTNIKMRRTNKSPIMPTSSIDEKDSAYWERRRKNNEAAKRSRDARRAKEDEIAIRAAFLEREYMRLMYENKLLKDENHQFRCLLYGR